MSPEQARGRAADKRSDIWAFGTVLYEMLTGRRAFDGDDMSYTLANILKSEPDWAALPADTPGPIRRVLRRCLEKDAKRRTHDIADVRLDLDEKEERVRSPAVARQAATFVTAERIALGAARRRPCRRARLRDATRTAARAGRPLSVGPPDNGFFGSNSYDRTRRRHQRRHAVARWHAARVRRNRPIRARRSSGCAGSTRSRHGRWPAPTNALMPFWSPDSRSVAFFADGKLKRLDIARRAPCKPSSTPLVCRAAHLGESRCHRVQRRHAVAARAGVRARWRGDARSGGRKDSGTLALVSS